MSPSVPAPVPDAVASAAAPPVRLRLIGIAVVGNEADIVEAFVRDNLEYVDHMLIAEHNTVDGTREILAALVEEGLPLTVRRIETPAFQQGVMTNALLKEAVERFDPDWIFPLDADEFLDARNRETLEAELAELGPRHGRLRWLQHVPTTLDDTAEEHPARRIRHRYDHPSPDPAVNPWVWKLMLNGRLIRPYLDRYALGVGSHLVSFKGSGEPASQPIRALRHAVLRHYPIRSFEQLSLKMGLGMLQRRLAGGDELKGGHFPKLHRLLLEGRNGISELQSAVREYLDTGRLSSDELAQTPATIDPKRQCRALQHGNMRRPATTALLLWIERHGGMIANSELRAPSSPAGPAGTAYADDRDGSSLLGHPSARQLG